MSKSLSTTSTDLLTVKSLKTLSGASLFVWVVCLVVSSLTPKGSLQDWHYRILAFILSILVTFTIVNYKKTRDKFMAMLLILGNTCYIFVNASGINAISKNQLFTETTKPATDSSSKAGAHNLKKTYGPLEAGFFSFLKEPDWWPDKEVINENTALKSEINSLNNKIDNGEEKKLLLDKILALGLQVQMLSEGKSDTEKKTIEENSRLAAEVRRLTLALDKEKNNSANLSNLLAAANNNYQSELDKYNQLLAKCSNADKTISSLTDQIFGLKADITGLKKSLGECNKSLTGCLNSKGNDKYAELYKTCIGNYNSATLALTRARDSLTTCLKKDQMKIPIKKADPVKIN